MRRPFSFADEIVPIQRPDVHARIRFQVNFLLLDARSVLSEWLSERTKSEWIFAEIFGKEGLPKDFVQLAPVLSGLSRNSSRPAGVGPWSLEKPCSAGEGVTMSEDSWHDDRLDLELSTRCFAARVKAAHKELGNGSWLMAAAAYVSSAKTVQEMKKRWNTSSFWDLPPVENADDLIVRWIAFAIINSHRELYGLQSKDQPPLTFDQVTGLIFAKDLSVAEIARVTDVSPREIMELNPKIRPSSGIFPATVGGKPIAHTVAAPKGKGWQLVEKLKKDGYLAVDPKP